MMHNIINNMYWQHSGVWVKDSAICEEGKQFIANVKYVVHLLNRTIFSN